MICCNCPFDMPKKVKFCSNVEWLFIKNKWWIVIGW